MGIKFGDLGLGFEIWALILGLLVGDGDCTLHLEIGLRIGDWNLGLGLGVGSGDENLGLELRIEN